MTTDQWEKYVEQAATELELFRPDVERVLAVVGPSIVEDTRERLVAAAARAVERDCVEDPRAAIASEIVERLAARRSEITPGRPGWGYLTEAIDMVNEVCGGSSK